jgi:exopolysaccharide production protein ExoZ
MNRNVRSIQFLRFVAAALVVFFHSIGALDRYFPGSISETLHYLAGVGMAGVHIFFVISGFVMVYSSFNDPSKEFSSTQFAIRRFIRIYPIYIVYALLYLVFHYILSGVQQSTAYEIAASLLLLPEYSSNIIGPGWTLSYEVYFYICFAIFMRLGMKRGLIALTVFFLGCIGLRLFTDIESATLHLLTNPLLLEFLFGAFIGYVALTSNIWPRTADIMLALALIGFTISLALGYSRWPSSIVWGIPSALLVGGLIFQEQNGKLCWFIKKLYFLGDSSYSLYLLHILLIDVFFLFALSYIHISNASAAYFAFLITCLCGAVAALAYKFIERHLVGSLQKAARHFD